MKIDVLPADLKTVKLRVTKRGPYINNHITIPIDVVKRHDLKDDEEIVVAFVCRAKENTISFE